ncbi:hypothetical protein SAMN04488007_0910 [Maribacter aquivivus]|uniref:Uncharacterized protein n=1 Tax=Maribacter aquivivus TaxID=228958 RepID=A0A1M6KTV9_9FLAO|nr:hypothetical protein [Maribacter aquivivus]SHJ62294.1 hypothetical protein SAMN04488007_0910 [Maribacter aquivivus]
MNTEFQIKENGFAEIKKALIIKTIPVAILAAGTGLTISHINSNGQTTDVNVLLFLIPLVVGALAFGLFKGINRQKELFESYKLIVNEYEIVREQNNTQTISIPRNEIKSIIKNPKGILTIVGNSYTDVIGVPSQINNSEKLEQVLSEIKPITYSDKKPLFEKYKGVLILIVLGLMATVFISTNKLLVGITGSILILFLGYSFYEVRRNKNIDKKTKNSMWWLLLVLFSVIGNMYFKITGKL